MKIDKFTAKFITFSDMKKIVFCLQIVTRNPMDDIWQRDQLTCDVCGNVIHSGKW